MSTRQLSVDPIKHFCPGACAEEAAHRAGIYRARDIGLARAMASKHCRARNLYWDVNGIASDWVFRSASIDELVEVRKTLLQLLCAAGALERLEAPDAA